MRTLFCGREAELAALAAAYERTAVQRTGPELIVVAAEAGLGKTRLVQELYNHLSVTHDGIGGAGYWPDDLGQIENNLKVNPTPAECNEAHPLPFLWWGVRLDDPGEKNAAVSGAVPSALPFLRPHLEPMYRARQAAESKGKLATIIGRGAIDALIDLVPGGGLIKTGAETAFELYTHNQQPRGDTTTVSLRDTDIRERRSQNELILDALGQLMGQDANALPTVILFDDGQFSPSDAGAVDLLEGLIDRASAGDWPVLILVTHWIAPWHAQQADQAPPSFAQAITQRARQLSVHWLELKPVPELDRMLSAVLPGLSALQRQALLERAGGNPRYLEQIVALAKGRPRYFAGRDTEGLLTQEGFADLSRATVDMQHTIEQRLYDAGPEVRRAVSLASVQGLRFLCSLTSEIAHALHLGPTHDSLVAAEHPHAFISGVERGIGDFAQRVFYEVAKGSLADIADLAVVETAFTDALRMRMTIGETVRFPSHDEAELTLNLTAALFEHAPDVEDRHRCAVALFNLMVFENDAHRYANALLHAERLWKGVADGRWTLERLGVHIGVFVGGLMQTAGRLPEAADVLRACMHVAYAQFAAEQTVSSKSNLARALTALGELYLLAGDVAKGSLAEAADAMDLAAQLTRSLDLQLRTPASRSALGWAYCRLGDVLYANGNALAAIPHYERADDILRDLANEVATDVALRDYAAVQLRLGDVGLAAHGPTYARDYLMRSYDIFALAAGRNPSLFAQTDFIHASLRLADLRSLTEGSQPALDLLGTAFTIAQRIATETGTPELMLLLSLTLEKLGDMTEEPSGRHEHYDKCLKIRRDLVVTHPTRRARRALAEVLKKLGMLAFSGKDLEEARTYFAEALTIVRALEEELANGASARDLTDLLIHQALLYDLFDDQNITLQILDEGIAAAETLRQRDPGSESDVRLSTLRSIERDIRDGEEDGVLDQLLTMARGDRSVALTTGRRVLTQLRAQLLDKFNDDPEERQEIQEAMEEYAAALQELEDAVSKQLH